MIEGRWTGEAKYQALLAVARSLLEEENLALREEIEASAAAGGIIGASVSLREVLERVARVAATDSTVLITGEAGTGKELIARAIHAGSSRAKRAMVKVNCAALPEGLVASELFGHERGAFTGALERRRGRFELAAGGTIFLDEVGELPAPVQVALLRVLQEREFERVGGSETLRTDARVVAATNRNLEEAVQEGKLRADLLFRLNVFPIRVPPPQGTGRGRPPAGRVLGEPLWAPDRQGDPRHRRSGDGRAVRVPVAGQHPRAPERRRASGDPRAWQRARPPRPRAARPRRRLATAGRRAAQRQRPPTDRGGARRQPRPRLRTRRGSRGARRPTQHARGPHPALRDRQARLPTTRDEPLTALLSHDEVVQHFDVVDDTRKPQAP
jgi:hypothetical protein